MQIKTKEKMETINLVKATKVPKPLDTQVLVKNPFYGKDAEMDKLEKELEKMPEKDRDAFRKEHFYEVWHKIDVVAVGPLVTDLAVGDQVISTAHAMQSVVVLCDEQYLMARRTNFVGKW